MLRVLLTRNSSNLHRRFIVPILGIVLVSCHRDKRIKSAGLCSARGTSSTASTYITNHWDRRLAHEGKFDSAIREYKTALSINPSLYGLNLDLGIAYFRKNDYSEAIVPLEKFLSANPADSQARELLGLSYVELDRAWLGEFDGAEDNLRAEWPALPSLLAPKSRTNGVLQP